MEKSAIFETSWEVCNKVGGIYTVLKSKAAHMKSMFKENFFLVGPYFPQGKQAAFEEKLPPEDIKLVFDELRHEGILCHFGKWLIPSSPNVILVDYSGYSHKNNEIKKDFYEKFGIDSLGSTYHDYDEPIVWSTAVGRMVEVYANSHKEDHVIVHCHEWLASGAGLYHKGKDSRVKVVFTTHATMLGRTLASVEHDFYNKLETYNPLEEAKRLGVHTKHQTEVAIAKTCDVFTTVSELTGDEAKFFLGRVPDVILPNGLDLRDFPTFEEISIKHKLFKRNILEFVQYALFPYYTFNLDDTIIMFTAARYEFRGKGLDVYIKALKQLDLALTKNFKGKTVVNFFFVPTGSAHGIDPEILENKTFFEDIRESIVSSMPKVQDRLLYRTLANKKIIKSDLFDDNTLRELKRKINRFQKAGSPKLCSHIINEDNDAILKGFKQAGLTNSAENAVKVFLYPIYLTGADGLLDMDYYQCIQACQFGIFPSFYEPWGYTPVEAAALGDVTLTTDLSGFGRFVLSHYPKKANQGIHVLPRGKATDDEFAEILSKRLYEFAAYSKDERINQKMEAKRFSNKFDWEHLIVYYQKAYEMTR